MGKSSGNQKVVNETKLPGWYDSASQQAIDFANTTADNLAKPYQGNTVAPLDPLQQQAIGLTGQNIGSTNAAYGKAQGGALAAMGYNPQMVGNGYNAMMLGANYSPQNVTSGTQGYGYNPLEVQGGSFLSGNIGAYMNPYIQNVEQSALGNMQQGYQQALNTIGDRAINAGAFGGSRQGVAEGTAASEFARQYGDLSANLRSQAYNAGTDLMGQDMSRGMQAQLANQQAGMSNAQFGANLGLQNIDNAMKAQLANQSAGLQGAQLNQQALLANQDALYNQFALQQQAALANQQAGLQGAQLNLEGATSLGNLASAGQQSYLQSLQAALSAGQINQDQAQALLAQDAARYDAMRNYPLEQLNIRMAPLGAMQVPTSSTQTRPTSGNFLTGALGGAMTGAQIGSMIPGVGTAVGAIGGGLLGGLSAR